MFSLNKRLIAGLLIVAMIFANAGMSTLAVSISHYVDEANKNAKDDSDITYRYYEEYRYSYESKTTLLMNDGGSQDSPVQGEGSPVEGEDSLDRGSEFENPDRDEAGAGAENTGAPEETTGISETDSSDFGVDENKSENNDDKEGSQSSPVQEEDGEEFGPWMDDADAGNDGEYEEESEDDAVTDGESEEGSTSLPVQEESSETSESETGETDIASPSDAEIETKEYDEEFGPWQDEKDVASASEAEESSAADEVDVASISEAEVQDANVASGSKINKEDLEVATVSELLPELAPATMSDLKLFGATPTVGSYIFFGTYPQSSTNYDVVDPIKWRVLKVEDDKVLLNADKILDNKSYHNTRTNVTWETSNIRSWANDTFYKKAFSADEKSEIKEVTIKTSDNGIISGGNDTLDKVFLADYSVASDLLGSIGGVDYRKRVGTNYARNVDNGRSKLEVNSGASNWFTRYPSSISQDEVLRVSYTGRSFESVRVDNTRTGFLPLIYLDTSKTLFNATTRNITWNLSGKSLLGESTWQEMTTYREGFAHALPTTGNFVSGNYTLSGWQINGSSKLYKEIPSTQRGNITLKAVFHDNHKLCGITGTCTHTEGESHSDKVAYEALNPDGMTDNEIVSLLAAGGNYHLVSTVSFATNKTITLTKDLYLCLNGSGLEKVVFAGDSYKLYITNCSQKCSTITNSTETETFQNHTTSIFGVNRNILVKANFVIHNKKMKFYSAKFTQYSTTTSLWYAFRYGSSTGNDNYMEDVEITGYQNVRVIVWNENHTGITFKNVHIHDNVVRKSIMELVNENDTIFKFSGNNIIENNTFQSASPADGGGNAILNGFMTNQGGLYHFADGETIIRNNKTTNLAHGILVFDRRNSGDVPNTLQIDEGASLKITGNSVKRLATYINYSFTRPVTGTVVFKDNSVTTAKIYGNLEVTNNKITNCNADNNNDVIAGLYLGLCSPELGSGKVVVSGNKAYSDEGTTLVNDTTYTNHHMYQVYSSITDDTTPLFTLASGKKYSALSSMSVAFPVDTANGKGVIIATWNNTTATDINSYKNIFSADTFGRDKALDIVKDKDKIVVGLKTTFTVSFMYNATTYTSIATQSVAPNGLVTKVASPSDPTGKNRKFVGWATKSDATKNDVVDLTSFVITENTKLFAVFDSHIHKICGVASGSCTHTLIDSHSNKIEYDTLNVSSMSDDEIVTLLSTGDSYYLIDDVTFTETKVITLSGTLNLCLAGHKLENVRFTTSGNNGQINITNCSDE
ncbi:MAG: InlB B-repeat-containing protein, partial [Lachnospiraceae bacterium]|nr:InlB B-repeat-containing protein [Lachnospiraceae bacterium]